MSAESGCEKSPQQSKHPSQHFCICAKKEHFCTEPMYKVQLFVYLPKSTDLYSLLTMYKWSAIPPTMFDFFIYLLVLSPFFNTSLKVARHNDLPEQVFCLLWESSSSQLVVCHSKLKVQQPPVSHLSLFWIEGLSQERCVCFFFFGRTKNGRQRCL